jgi:hypothetical protein
MSVFVENAGEDTLASWRYTEEGMVKVPNILFEKVRFLDITSSMMLTVWVIESIDIETFRRDLCCDIVGLLEQIPQLFRRV